MDSAYLEQFASDIEKHFLGQNKIKAFLTKVFDSLVAEKKACPLVLSTLDKVLSQMLQGHQEVHNMKEKQMIAFTRLFYQHVQSHHAKAPKVISRVFQCFFKCLLNNSAAHQRAFYVIDKVNQSFTCNTGQDNTLINLLLSALQKNLDTLLDASLTNVFRRVYQQFNKILFYCDNQTLHEDIFSFLLSFQESLPASPLRKPYFDIMLSQLLDCEKDKKIKSGNKLKIQLWLEQNVSAEEKERVGNEAKKVRDDNAQQERQKKMEEEEKKEGEKTEEEKKTEEKEKKKQEEKTAVEEAVEELEEGGNEGVMDNEYLKKFSPALGNYFSLPKNKRVAFFERMDSDVSKKIKQ